ncbi:hypothetical protein [Burkholderia pseudomultivorans]|uniref:hypothetical protein n=1 Tax=Burkholderia pseudomultivorans TaxID=1207504 RepID=UPI000B192C81|nr:hypothetical protein [Burkholderia pseudomultivorans]
MSKFSEPDVRNILLSFASLSEAGRKHFISQMNQYLLASSSQRKQIADQWKRSNQQDIRQGKPR